MRSSSHPRGKEQPDGEKAGVEASPAGGRKDNYVAVTIERAPKVKAHNMSNQNSFQAVLERALTEEQEALLAVEQASNWKDRMLAKRLAARKKILPGFPRRTPFSSHDDAKAYLSTAEICCLVCGKTYQALANHLRDTHAISLDEYREGYRIPWTFGLTAATLAAKKSKILTERLADPDFAETWFLNAPEHRLQAHERARQQRDQPFRTEQSRKHLALAGIEFERWQESDFFAILSAMIERDALLKDIAGKIEGLPPLGAAIKWFYSTPARHKRLVATVHRLSIQNQVRARMVSQNTKQQLKSLRTRGLLQREIAEMIGISVITVSRLLKREVLRLE